MPAKDNALKKTIKKENLAKYTTRKDLNLVERPQCSTRMPHENKIRKNRKITVCP